MSRISFEDELITLILSYIESESDYLEIYKALVFQLECIHKILEGIKREQQAQ